MTCSNVCRFRQRRRCQDQRAQRLNARCNCKSISGYSRAFRNASAGGATPLAWLDFDKDAAAKIRERNHFGSPFWATDIGAKLDAKSRDENIAGFRRLAEASCSAFSILPGRRRTTGRPGMAGGLVMGVLKRRLRPPPIVNRHADVQAFLARLVRRYADPTMTPELLRRERSGSRRAGRRFSVCDSFVVERSTIRPTSICFGIRPVAWSGRRRGPADPSAFPDGAGGGIGSRVGELFDAVRTASSQRSRPDAVRDLKACFDKAEGSLEALKGAGCPEPALEIGAQRLNARAATANQSAAPRARPARRSLGVPVCIVEDGNVRARPRDPVDRRRRRRRGPSGRCAAGSRSPTCGGAVSTGASTARRIERRRSAN